MFVRRLLAPGLAVILASCTPPAALPPAAASKAPPAPSAPSQTVKQLKKDAEKGVVTGNGGEDGGTGVAGKTPSQVSALTAQARKAAEGGDLKKAVALLDQALAAVPQDHDALWLLARVTQHQAADAERPESSPLFLRSAAAMRQLSAAPRMLSPQEKAFLAIALYNEARTFAAQGEKDQALKSLGEAVAAGFDPTEIIDADADLNPLRDRPEFQALARKLEERAEARAREHAQELLASTKPFPFHFELPDVTGKTVALADFRGKVTVVDIWGTWCPPCRAEVPHLVALYQKYHPQGLEIVGLNYEQEDDEKKVKEATKSFVAEHKVPYPCLIGDSKTQDQVPDFEGYPTTLFLDRAGTVRAKLVGFAPSHAGDLKALVEKLLAEEKPRSAGAP